MIRRPLALLLLSLPLAACDSSGEEPVHRRGDAVRPSTDGDGAPKTEETACAAFLSELVDAYLDGPSVPWWATGGVTPGGVIGLGGGSVGVGNGGTTSIGDLDAACAEIEDDLGLPEGYLRPMTEAVPGGYVEGCGCTDCGMEPDAEGLDTFDSVGLGDAVSPHEIYNPEQLADLAEAEPAWSRHYVQCADIDLDPYYASGGDEFNIATEDDPFTGVYDGGGNTVSHYSATGSRGGLFDTLSSARLENLELHAAAVQWSAPNTSGFHFGGALANRVLENSRVSGVSAEDISVVATREMGACWAGGLLGQVRDSQADDIAVVDLELVGDRCRVGGVVGWAVFDTALSNLSSTDGSVEALSDGITSNGGGSAAGLVAGMAFGPSLIGCSVSGGSVQGEYAGGVVQNLQNETSLVSGCSSDVEVRGNSVGGLIERVTGGTLQDSHSTGPVLPFPGSPYGSRKGGAVGYVTSARLARVWSSSDISTYGTTVGSAITSAGGLVGNAGQSGLLQIEDSFALGDIDVAFGSTTPVDAGGLIGRIEDDVVLDARGSFAAGDVEGTTTGSYIGRVSNTQGVVTESFGIGHHLGTGGCFVGEGTINEDGNNYVADIPCACTVEPGVSTAPLADFDQPNDNLGFSWSAAVWAFADNMLPSLQ